MCIQSVFLSNGIVLNIGSSDLRGFWQFYGMCLWQVGTYLENDNKMNTCLIGFDIE